MIIARWAALGCWLLGYAASFLLPNRLQINAILISIPIFVIFLCPGGPNEVPKDDRN